MSKHDWLSLDSGIKDNLYFVPAYYFANTPKET